MKYITIVVVTIHQININTIVIQGSLVYWCMYMYAITEFKHEPSCDMILEQLLVNVTRFMKSSLILIIYIKKYNFKYAIQD